MHKKLTIFGKLYTAYCSHEYLQTFIYLVLAPYYIRKPRKK